MESVVSSAAVWRSTDFADNDEWTATLSVGERDEIVAAARSAVAAGLSAGTVGREDFPLPLLAPKLADWVRELNAKILHAREAYTDYDDPAERRHLLQLWLTAHAFASVEETLRAGIPARKES